MRRKILSFCMLLIILIGFGCLFRTFTSALNPSSKAKSERVRIDISAMACGTYQYQQFDRANAWNEKVLVIRDFDCSIRTFLLPTKAGKTIMPDRFWTNDGFLCDSFGPDVDPNNNLVPDGYVRCQDPQPEADYIRGLKWTLSGKSESAWTVDDLLTAKFELQGNELVLNR